MTAWVVTIGEPLAIGAESADRVWRTGYLARLLARRGHTVTWWTSTFNHAQKTHWFDRSTTVEAAPGLQIRLVEAPGYRRNLSLARFRDHRVLARTFRRDIAGALQPDVILVSLPTVELSLAAVEYSRARGIPVIVDLRDMWPDIFVEHTPPLLRPVMRLAVRPLLRQARAACAGATGLVGITDEFLEWGLTRAGRPRGVNDRVFPHAYMTEPPAPAALAAAASYWDAQGIREADDGLTVVFVGTINVQFDLDTVLRAAARLREAGRPIRFVFCGVGDRLETYRAASASLPNVRFVGWVDLPKIHVLLRRAHVGLDPIPARYDFLATVNNKAIEYLSAGLPVASSPNEGVLASLLADTGAGFSYEAGDADGLAARLEALLHDPAPLQVMCAQAHRLFDARFRADLVYGEFATYLEELAIRR